MKDIIIYFLFRVGLLFLILKVGIYLYKDLRNEGYINLSELRKRNDTNN